VTVVCYNPTWEFWCYFIGQYSILPGFEIGYNGSLPNECDSTYKFAILARLPQTDASKQACGAVLTQNRDGIQLPIAYASRSFTEGENNNSTTEQELAAIHWAITHFRLYIYGKHFTIKTDHRPLTYLFSMTNPSSKLTRMRLKNT